MGEITVGQWLWSEYIFTIAILFHYFNIANISIPLEKCVTLHMNKLESSLTIFFLNLKVYWSVFQAEEMKIWKVYIQNGQQWVELSALVS